MENKEILEEIKLIQHYIDSYINTATVRFNPTTDINILEKIYNKITDKKYSKFNSGCGSCITEALIITNNYRKREEKIIEEAEKLAKKEVKKPVTKKPVVKKTTTVKKENKK